MVISFLPVDNFLNDVASLGKHNWKVITGERSSKESVFNTWRAKIFGLFQKQSDYIVCNSENARKMWIKYYPQYESKLNVIYNNVQLPAITSEYRIRKNGKTHIVIAAAYSYVKDPQDLIKALALMTDEQCNMLSVEWYGKIGANTESDCVYRECEDLIADNGLEHVITLKDVTLEIANKMTEADVVALFSKLEGLPNSICEGMTLKKPVLMTRISDYAQLIDETNGYLCDVQSPQSIKDALIRILNTSNETLIQKGEVSKMKANILFSEQRIVAQWIKIID